MCFLFVVLSVGASDAMHRFHSIHLPCEGSMWESRSREDWEKEFYINNSAVTSPQLTSFYDLYTLQNRAQGGSVDDIKRLDEWNSGSDVLGMLITMALTTA